MNFPHLRKRPTPQTASPSQPLPIRVVLTRDTAKDLAEAA